MSVIRLKESNCKNCYRCIRECAVKSIEFKNDQARILDNQCVVCGNCLMACPQNAKVVVSDIDKARDMLRKHRVAISLAPSFPAFFPGLEFARMSDALKKLGAEWVEETAIGATEVSQEYRRLIREGQMKNIITTACPSSVLLVEKYFPELIPQLAPVHSPMISHALMMREMYGNRIKVLFVGPCVTKIHEAAEYKGGQVVNAAITFQELKGWLSEVGIQPETCEADPRVMKNSRSTLYPVPGGIIANIRDGEKLPYRCIAVDGVDRCIDTLKALRDDKLSGYFIEMNMCAEACLGGIDLRSAGISAFVAKDRVLGRDRSAPAQGALGFITEGVRVPLKHGFVNRTKRSVQYEEADIRRVLAKIGKPTVEQEINCGGCGYNTCREKAIAVLDGKADPMMCLPYVRERAESVSNLIIEHTPTAIVVVDDKGDISEVNPSAEVLFHTKQAEMIGKPLELFFPEVDLGEVRDGKQSITSAKIHHSLFQVTVEQSMVHVAAHRMTFLLFKDITQEEQHMKEELELRKKTVDIAQMVIDKQMRVAQEIASLLGETTAETKVALTRLKRVMQPEPDGR